MWLAAALIGGAVLLIWLVTPHDGGYTEKAEESGCPITFFGLLVALALVISALCVLFMGGE